MFLWVDELLTKGEAETWSDSLVTGFTRVIITVYIFLGQDGSGPATKTSSCVTVYIAKHFFFLPLGVGQGNQKLTCVR